MEFGTPRNKLGTANIGVSFLTSSQRNDACGTNGLPVTPNSIRILGEAQFLKALSHPNLAAYLDIIRGKHERIILVSEYHCNNVKKLMRQDSVNCTDKNQLVHSIAGDVLCGLHYLNNHGIIMRNLSPENILLDSCGRAKLFNYGVYHMTNKGSYVNFPIGNPKYLPPEVLLGSNLQEWKLPSVDCWALGLILLELFVNTEFWQNLKLAQILEKVSSLSHFDKSDDLIGSILEEHGYVELVEMREPVKKLLSECLRVDYNLRLSPPALLFDSAIFPEQPVFLTDQILENNTCSLYCMKETANIVDLKPNVWFIEKNDKFYAQLQNPTFHVTQDPLSQRSIQEIYYLWQRAGGDVLAELKRQGFTRKKPSALSTPQLMMIEGTTQGHAKERGFLYDSTVVILPFDELRKRLNDIANEDYFPLCCPIKVRKQNGASTSNADTVNLPLIIRERDIEYQFHRIVLFERLLKGYPCTKRLLYENALLDIPPFFRPQIWSCLLEIRGDVQSVYKEIDKETPTSTDRQIEVDIPRCHQYDELLSSPRGHDKFKRILKAWVVSNKEYVYWQGLDSLCAPFLSLHFNNEAMAFACLSAFIPKYLYNFFLKDNSVVIQEYLCKFSQLIAFHDPELSNHLDSIGFIPALYAIPWFLTMFSHVFPLHKIFHLWDRLLLGDSSFSLCIGLAILYQLRESLLNAGFNECILLFSDMPEINIEKCVQDSFEIYSTTPRSAFRRQNEPPRAKRSVQYPEYVTEAMQMEPIPLDELKQEKCPRISGEELLKLLDIKNQNPATSDVLVIDVRNHEDFNRGAVPGSINIPFATAFTQNFESLLTCHEMILRSNRGKILCCVGNRDSSVKFSEALLRLGYARICVLHRGIDIFRSSNLLIVPASV